MSNRTLGVILLCVWLVLTGLLMISNFKFDAQNVVMGFLAIAAGGLIAFGK